MSYSMKTQNRQDDDISTDADCDKNSYRNKLLTLDNDLTLDNIKCLKFLCLDIIRLAKLENITLGTELFEILEQYQLLGPGDWYFLAECLDIICRRDLSNIILEKSVLQLAIKARGSQIPPYRKLLFDICEDLDNDEISKGVYLYGKIPKSKRGNITTGMDFIGYLEQAQAVTVNDLKFLVYYLQNIGRGDLQEKVLEYLKPTDSFVKRKISNDGSPTKPLHMPNDVVVDDKKNKHVDDYSIKINADSHITKKTEENNPRPQHQSAIPYPVLIEIAYQLCQDKECIINLGQQLGSTKQIVDQLSEQHPGRPDMVVLSVLTNWIQKCDLPIDRMIDTLTDAISACGKADIAANFNNVLHGNYENNRDIPMDTSSPPTQVGNAEFVPPREIEHRNIYVSSAEARITEPEENNPPNQHQSENAEGIHYSLPPAFEIASYRMDRKPRGICVIIDNEKFTHNAYDPNARHMKNRNGSHIDREKLVKTFSELNFEVEGHVHENLSAVEMVRIMTGTAFSINHSQYDCFVACILSHGTRDHVFGADGKTVPIRELTGPFKALNCASLIDKPKLFFIQACQGQDKQRGRDIERDSTPETDIDEDASNEVIPNEADFLLGMATVPGFVSYRSKTMGSWYITKLCESLDRYAFNVDLLNLLTMVNFEVGQANADIEGGRYKQSPAPFYTLRKQVKFSR